MDHAGRIRLAERFSREARRAWPDRVQDVILFGSVARGDDRDDSDIDVLVLWAGDVEEGRRLLVARACSLLLESGEYLSVKVARPEDYRAAIDGGNPFAEAVRAEGRALA